MALSKADGGVTGLNGPAMTGGMPSAAPLASSGSIGAQLPRSLAQRYKMIRFGFLAQVRPHSATRNPSGGRLRTRLDVAAMELINIRNRRVDFTAMERRIPPA